MVLYSARTATLMPAHSVRDHGIESFLRIFFPKDSLLKRTKKTYPAVRVGMGHQYGPLRGHRQISAGAGHARQRRNDEGEGFMPLEGEYEPSPEQWVRDQVELFESSGGAKGNTSPDIGLPVIVMTTRGAKSGKIRKT